MTDVADNLGRNVVEEIFDFATNVLHRILDRLRGCQHNIRRCARIDRGTGSPSIAAILFVSYAAFATLSEILFVVALCCSIAALTPLVYELISSMYFLML